MVDQSTGVDKKGLIDGGYWTGGRGGYCSTFDKGKNVSINIEFAVCLRLLSTANHSAGTVFNSSLLSRVQVETALRSRS